MPEYMGVAKNTTSNIEEFFIECVSRLQEELEKLQFVAVHTDGGSSSYCSSFNVVGLNGVTEGFDAVAVVVGLNGVTEGFDAVAEVSEAHTAENFWKETFQKLGDIGGIVKNVTITTDYEEKMFGDFNNEEITGCLAHLRLATAR